MTYDRKCFDLAEHFIDGEIIAARIGLTEHTERVKKLAEHIQAEVEAWIETNPPSTAGASQ